MTVTAVVPHWNRRDLLRTLLGSLRDQTAAFDEIIVVDNGSTDDSVEVAEKAGARVLRMGRNFGFAAAVNRGIAAAGTDWVAVLNNDVVLERDWLGVLVAAAEREGAWFATGKILQVSAERVEGDPRRPGGMPHQKGTDGILDGTFDEISMGGCAYRCGAGRPDSEIWNRGRSIRLASMTAGLFRRTLFKEIGTLDETFESYLEDVDFGLRCALAGRTGVYEPAAVAHHLGSATLGAWNSDTVRLIARNQVLLTTKHFRGQARWPILAGQLLWGVLALRHAKGISYLRGKLAGFREARLVRGDGGFENRDRLRAIVEASEREIFEAQRETGFDWYWRTYFWLRRR